MILSDRGFSGNLLRNLNNFFCMTVSMFRVIIKKVKRVNLFLRISPLKTLTITMIIIKAMTITVQTTFCKVHTLFLLVNPSCWSNPLRASHPYSAMSPSSSLKVERRNNHDPLFWVPPLHKFCFHNFHKCCFYFTVYLVLSSFFLLMR